MSRDYGSYRAKRETGRPLEVNEIRSIANETLEDFMYDRTWHRTRTRMNAHELPAFIIQTGKDRGKIPKSGSMDDLTERRILDVIGMLLNEGIITWGGSIGSGDFNTGWISITEY